ncbi:MAG: hypothetical protein PUA60_06560 [Methanobacteriaceae archaeon]|nr:hypothetical protein [Methanobacteriaceae archaeon]
MTGIINWKTPKKIPYHKTCILVKFFCVKPLVKETLKASIAKPIANNKIAKNSISIKKYTPY